MTAGGEAQGNLAVVNNWEGEGGASLRQTLRRLLLGLPGGAGQRLIGLWRGLRTRWQMRRASRYDRLQFLRHSGVLGHAAAPGSRSQGVLQAAIRKTYHRLEKGLALSEPRPGFGADAVATLRADLDEYLARFAPDTVSLEAVNTLTEYLAFNHGQGLPMPRLTMEVERLRARHALRHEQGGTRLVERESLWRDARLDLRAFFAARHSIRQFAPRAVDLDLIRAAVAMAAHSPSVCNRQAGQVYVLDDPVIRAQALALQNGNRGFGHQAGTILVVTTRLDCFLTVGERYQPWIDGGLFAMSLIYALHSLGLGTCCLNWSVEPAADQALKAATGIPDDQCVIFLLAVGHLPERLRVTQSPRREAGGQLHVL